MNRDRRKRRTFSFHTDSVLRGSWKKPSAAEPLHPTVPGQKTHLRQKTRPIRSHMLYIESEFGGDLLWTPRCNWLSRAGRRQCLTWKANYWTLGIELQMSFKKRAARISDKTKRVARNLTELKRGESGILDRLDLPEDDARRLMELGFIPGHAVIPAHSAPGGDPRVFRVDGSEVALRRETAMRLLLR
ncbi:MAG: ferrous iron transport protein A [Acidobacteriia bacterium]|nr:ferrous iron transport protein A [Terriglobia bacterium]